jgi:hypothetical protein
MSSTTVRVHHRHKKRLEELQTQWRRKTGKAPTQQDILGHLLDHAATHLDQIIAEMEWKPLTNEEFEALCAQAVDVGEPLDLTTDIDDTVYDWDREMGNKK